MDKPKWVLRGEDLRRHSAVLASLISPSFTTDTMWNRQEAPLVLEIMLEFAPENGRQEKELERLLCRNGITAEYRPSDTSWLIMVESQKAACRLCDRLLSFRYACGKSMIRYIRRHTPNVVEGRGQAYYYVAEVMSTGNAKFDAAAELALDRRLAAEALTFKKISLSDGTLLYFINTYDHRKIWRLSSRLEFNMVFEIRAEDSLFGKSAAAI